MAYKIYNWKTKEVIHEYGESAKECLENGINNGVCFNYARLNYAVLNYAVLSGAELSDAELNYAELNYAELNYARLSGAVLNYAKLNGAVLNYAELNYAKLNGAELSDAKLNYARLSGAELSGAELNYADTHSIKYEFFGKLALQFDEISGLRQALIDGKIDGSVYLGECACFVGTIAYISNSQIENLRVEKKANSLTERWFLAINKGDTPETNQVSKITVEWIDEFLTKCPFKRTRGGVTALIKENV